MEGQEKQQQGKISKHNGNVKKQQHNQGGNQRRHQPDQACNAKNYNRPKEIQVHSSESNSTKEESVAKVKHVSATKSKTASSGADKNAENEGEKSVTKGNNNGNKMQHMNINTSTKKWSNNRDINEKHKVENKQQETESLENKQQENDQIVQEMSLENTQLDMDHVGKSLTITVFASNEMPTENIKERNYNTEEEMGE
ncbi:uncharacterized protein LOC132035077 [Lycium ferocissimum]|uniref:uncharacterized protein LOC132035077 n=1 Tax=Lycium ferocissimum TaxID=112874 RepID=UPI002815329C|nr:uncharacterized protein LOC132035077 [Lycium ferocissimum]